jgi:uncharacterized protein with FMN-binding domain
MRRISYWLLSTISAVVLLVGFDASRHDAATAPPATSSIGSGDTSSGSTTGTASGSRGNGTDPQTKKSSQRSGGSTTVTGAVEQTQWGPVQVQLVVTDGSITKVTVLQYPNGNPRDAEINSYALPILIKETTEQQNAKIDMVSGATVTSTGYVQSLQSALDQARL